MGQYYLICNIDRREYIHPHKFNDGLKLLELAIGGAGAMTGLAVLMSDGNGRGMGDLKSTNPVIGSWSGDRVVISGDYSERGKFVQADYEGNLYQYAMEHFIDISYEVLDAITDDQQILRQYQYDSFRCGKMTSYFTELPDKLRRKFRHNRT